MTEPKPRILLPMHPERVCWGCDRYCPSDNLSCGRDTVRTPHPMELFGEDWMDWCEANGGGNTAERLWGPAAPSEAEQEAASGSPASVQASEGR